MGNRWNRYPRPQLKRDKWLSLDGEWKFKTQKINEPDDPGKWETINVPYSPESELSGIGRRVSANDTMVYEREISVPEDWKGSRVILHFGAVDQTCKVFVNGEEVISHEGGYLPFSVDITDKLSGEAKDTIRVEAHDSLDHKYPWGKQKSDNGGMWYTPVSGIWQSVWAEPVPEDHVTHLKIDTGRDWAEIRAYGVEKGTIEIMGEKYELIKDDAAYEKRASIRIDIHYPHRWSPEDPYLYDFTIESGDDKLESYFALRTLSIQEVDGVPRLCLNDEPYFFNGVLDQGYWQSGIYTPPTDEAFEEDIMAMKSLGFNTLRKHIKVEPELFYYDCDRLGMVVFQDMVNNFDYSFFKDSALPTIGLKNKDDRGIHRDPESRKLFTESMEGIVKQLYNHPSICYWTIFNEGWGQFSADEMYEQLRYLDPVRFIDSTSGWFHQSKSDVDSHHVYFKKIDLSVGNRPLVLSEFGGYTCRVEGHCFNENTYGYKKFGNRAELLAGLRDLYDNEIEPLMKAGLSAAIYTQLSDVEEETNGLLTYDREVHKFKAYVGTGRIEIIGNHTDHQGGRVIAAPAPHKIKAFVADNGSDVIRVVSDGHKPFEVSLVDRTHYEKGTAASLVTGMLDGFADLFGAFDAAGRGFDVHMKSEVPVGSGLSSSAAFEILVARIINDRFFANQANAVELAKIGMFAERDYYGKPCGLLDQLAIALGRPALIDFRNEEPDIEFVDLDLEKAGYTLEVVPTESDHAELDDDYASIPDDMFAVAKALGVERLSDLNEEQFKRKRKDLAKLVEKGELKQLQVDRAQHFFDENERVLAAATALEVGNIEKFISCINESGLSSENLLKNVVPPTVKENGLSRALKEYKARPDTAAVRLIGGGFGGSILVIKRK